jgi:hypothetical protein
VHLDSNANFGYTTATAVSAGNYPAAGAPGPATPNPFASAFANAAKYIIPFAAAIAPFGSTQRVAWLASPANDCILCRAPNINMKDFENAAAGHGVNAPFSTVSDLAPAPAAGPTAAPPHPKVFGDAAAGHRANRFFF